MALLIVAGLVAASVYGARQLYFLGVDEGGRMALYRGLPYDLPFGIELYDERYSSPVQFASLPSELRSNVTEHELRSRDDAVSLIEEYEEAAATAAPGGDERPPGSGDGGGRAGDGKRQGAGRQQGGKRQGGGNRQGGGGKRSGNR